MRGPGIELIGHRGAPREFPENSLPAFQRAFERGAAGVELDVHVTLDGVVVVRHDPTLPRRGRRAISEVRWEDVSAIELASGIGIPRLDQVLVVVPVGRTAYVELKGAGVERAAIDVIRAGSAQCAVHSFDHDMVARAAELAPEIPRGLLFERYPEDVIGAMRRTGARDVWPQWKLIDAPLVDAVHAEGGRVIAWTVNSKVAGDALATLGVDGLCGDDVRLLATSG